MATRAKKSKTKQAEEAWPLSPEAAEAALPEVREATPEEWHALIDEAAHYYLDMSADEFMRRWESGEFPNPDGTPVMNVVMLLSIDEQRAGARAIQRRQQDSGAERGDAAPL